MAWPLSKSPSSGGARADECRRGFAALLLRGGRLTKLAGEVASCAPALGGTAVALLCALSVPIAGILSGAFLGLTAQQAMAACDSLPGGLISCSGTISSTYTKTETGLANVSVKVEQAANVNVTSGLHSS